MEDYDDAEELDYVLDDFDWKLLRQVMGALLHCFAHQETSWAQRVSLAKLLHVYSRLPDPSAATSVEVTLYSPRYQFGAEEVQFYLHAEVSDLCLTIRFGGHYRHPRSGGDSFSVLYWRAAPGEEAGLTSYADSLGVVTALIDPMEVLRDMTTSPSVSDLALIDHENNLLDDEPGEEDLGADEPEESADQADTGDEDLQDDDEFAQTPKVVQIAPVTEADRALLAQVGAPNLRKTCAGMAYGIETCDGCGMSMAGVGLLVDGQAPGGAWGNYCAACSLALGLTIGWGKGQVYARQSDGTWRGVAGFES